MDRFQVVVDPDLEAIMDRYMDIRFQELAELEQAISGKDGESVRLLGHRLKGTGTSYGFKRLTDLGADIEIAGKAGDFDTARTSAATVREYLENVDIRYGE